MEPLFKDRWLLQHTPDEPLNHLSVYRLTPRDGHWFIQEAGDWTSFAGSHEALSSLAMPETEVILNVMPHAQPSGESSAYWCQVHSNPARIQNIPVLRIHADVVSELAQYGNILTVIACEHHEDWEKAPRLVSATQHELSLIQHWAELQGSHPIGRIQWIGLAFRLYIQAPKNHQRVRLCGVVLLICALGMAQWIQTKWTNDIQVPIQPHPVPQTETPQHGITPNWLSWQQQLKRLGEGNRANMEKLQWHWNEKGLIYSAVELIKPRKRLPKGCEGLEESTHLVCVSAPEAEGKKQ
jgi:hypothetical protein